MSKVFSIRSVIETDEPQAWRYHRQTMAHELDVVCPTGTTLVFMRPFEIAPDKYTVLEYTRYTDKHDAERVERNLRRKPELAKQLGWLDPLAR
jgi:hypothetical protein